MPFLLSAIAFDAAQGSLGFIKRHYTAIQVGAGVLLLTTGVLVISGELFRLNIEAQHLLGRFGLNFFQSV